MRTNTVITVPRSWRGPATSLPVDKTLRTTSIPLFAIRPIPSNLHLRGHGDSVIGFEFRAIVANLVISSSNGSNGLVVRPRREARRFQVVAQPGPPPTAGGAGVRAGGRSQL
ncbi:hypothetical protein N7536_010803 [Penicillium majusculum]|uniref:Uncharacterized protein n=1 Tax=Penicillium solitum TaxID=60172 RepID=A0A1V6QYS9_9EURO|nr:uncharacterized protein PENSOL_c026G01542 [Penicillium solitum]KAJ5688184.1 hypothetical protein N7536_010803 [Penicillium majusculum]OQD94338.1 hypothetical protein PENSOL_c026G01542 [Penicillium solitum]